MGTCFGCFPDDLPVHHGTYGSVEGNARAPEKQGVLVVMRHSVRLDAALVAATWSDQEQRPYDSPISDWELPVAACSLLRSRGLGSFDTIVVSPFRRCLQTAGVCAAALGGSRTVRIDRSLGELTQSVRRVQRERWGDESAERPHGVVQYLSAQAELALLRAASLDVVAAVDERRGEMPPRDETHRDGHARYVRAMEALRDNEVRRGERVLVVTHGDAVAATLRALCGEEAYETDECCWVAFSFASDGAATKLASSRVKTMDLG